ncbi:MAG: flagellar basal body-associated protein FliL [Xanthobacteraceae bacterium]
MASKPKKEVKAETDEEDVEGEGAESPPSKWKLKLPSAKVLIIAAAAIVVFGGGGAGAYFFFSSPKDAKHAAAAPVTPAVFVDLPDVLVNLANTGGERTQYLKVKVTLEVPDQALAQQIQPLMPRVMDAFQTYLREMRPTDLDGSAGLYRLKEELTRRVNTAIAPGRVNAVLFKEIVVQ